MLLGACETPLLLLLSCSITLSSPFVTHGKSPPIGNLHDGNAQAHFSQGIAVVKLKVAPPQLRLNPTAS